MNEQTYNCEKCKDRGMEYYTWRLVDGRPGGFGLRHCDCSAATRMNQRLADLAQMGRELKAWLLGPNAPQ